MTDEKTSKLKVTPFIRNVLICTPLVFLTLLPFAKLAAWLGVALSIKLMLLGALGWWLALLLRLPVILIAKAVAPEKARTLIVAASGPAEELVRLAFLLVLGLSIEVALSLGIGWAAIEIVYGLVQGFAMGVLQQKDDEKAREAKGFIRLQGMERVFEDQAPFWGILERLSANGVHVAFSLLLVVSPWLVVITVPLHSAINFLVAGLMRRSFALAEGLFVVASLTLLAVALSLLS